MKNRKTFLILASLLFTTSVHSAQEAKGGKAVLCAGKAPVILDYYNAALPTVGIPSPAVDLEKLSLTQARATIEKRVQLINPFLHTQYMIALQEIGRLEVWTLADLKEVNDTNEVYYLPRDCSLAQAAVRQNRTVFLDSTLYGVLTPGQLAVLEAHEAFYFIGEMQLGLTSSEKIREIMKYVLAVDLKQDLAVRTAAAMGGYVYPSQAVLFNISPGGQGWVTYLNTSDVSCTLHIFDPRGTRPSNIMMVKDLPSRCFGPKAEFPGGYFNEDLICGADYKTCQVQRGTPPNRSKFLVKEFAPDASSFTLVAEGPGFDGKPMTFELER